MSKIIIITLTIFIFFTTAFAQTNKTIITGTVKTADGNPAEFINIALKDTYFGTVTDGSGNFSFEAPAGKYTMIVYSISAHNQEFPVEIKVNGQNHFPDIVVMEKSQELEAVVVTGQFFPQSLNRSVYKVRVINAAQIEQKAASSVESLLNTEIGVRISNDMALGETNFEIMGMSGNNVKVLIDGIPLVDRLSTKQSLSQIDINTIERVEIVEGPMSVMYGTDALAGVINIITKKGKSDGNKKLAIGARVQEETIGKEYKPFYNKGVHIENINIQYNFANGIYAGGNFTRNSYGGFQGDYTGRKKEWPAKEQYMGGVQIGINKKKYDLMYKLDYLNEEILIKGDVPENRKATDVQFLADRFTHQLQANWKASDRVKVSFSASYQDYQRDKESTVINFATSEKYPSTGEGARDESNYSVLFGRSTVVWKALQNLNIQAGLEFQHNQGIGDKIEEDHNVISNAAFFLSAEYSPFTWLDIRPGVRSSYNSVYSAPLAIPSLNLKFKLNEKMDIRTSYGRGFRAPTLQELYYTFYHVNGGGFWLKGNPNLRAEASDSYMASWVWRPVHGRETRLTTTVSGFFNDYKDRIEMVTSVDAADTRTYYNTGKYQTLGATLENNLKFKNLTATVSISAVGRYNKLYDNTNFVGQSQTRFRYSPEISTSLTYDWTKVATFNLFYKYTSPRLEFVEKDERLVLAGMSAFHWADLTINRPINNYLNISGGIKNIFDVTKVKDTVAGTGHESTSTSARFMGAGRSYFLGLTFKLNKKQ